MFLNFSEKKMGATDQPRYTDFCDKTVLYWRCSVPLTVPKRRGPISYRVSNCLHFRGHMLYESREEAKQAIEEKKFMYIGDQKVTQVLAGKSFSVCRTNYLNYQRKFIKVCRSICFAMIGVINLYHLQGSGNTNSVYLSYLSHFALDR